MTYPIEIIVRENFYNNIDSKRSEHFLAIYDYQDKWNSITKYDNNLIYHIYEYVKNSVLKRWYVEGK